MKKLFVSLRMFQKLISFSCISLLMSACFGSTSVSVSTQAGPTKSATLNWTAGTGVITGYIIEQSTDNITFTTAQTVGNVTTATATGLAPSNTYYFRVRSYNSGGSSSASAIASLNIN